MTQPFVNYDLLLFVPLDKHLLVVYKDFVDDATYGY